MSDPGPLLAGAHDAAQAGDLETAERLLREALALQEASLGPVHADLANTVNNLAVVCEQAGKFAEAESGYRRAHAIAVAALAPRHPFVATSLRNLVDFCAARGIPLWAPPAAANGAPLTAPGHPPAGTVASPVLERAAAAPAIRRSGRPRAAAMLLLAGAMAAVLLIVAWRDRSGPAPTAPQRPRSVSERAASSPAPAVPPTANGRVTEPVPAPVATERPLAPARPAPRGVSSRSGTVAAPVGVLRAAVCSAFDRRGSPDWQCSEVSGSVAPGTFTFYTRVLVGSDTTIEHRWYRNNRLHQTSRLRVRPGGPSGYRTFSRVTIGAERAGDWRVELRAADGTVLRELPFAVR